MFPIAVMPKWMVEVTNFNPVTWAVKAMEIVLWKGGAWNELLLPVCITFGAGVFFFVISLRLFRWTGQR
jgi:ABC-type multidrug transport system permease subunit